MSQDKQQLHPKRSREPEPEVTLSAAKPKLPKKMSDLNIDQLMSKDAQEWLENNQQKGGE